MHKKHHKEEEHHEKAKHHKGHSGVAHKVKVAHDGKAKKHHKGK